MLLTRECDYGIRIIRALSCGTKKNIDVISDEEHIPQKYAYKIIKKMVRAGLVSSMRGRIGGYNLNKPLTEFNLYDIVVAIGDDRYIKDCLKPDFVCPFRENPDNMCTVHGEIASVQDIIMVALCKKTMAEILNPKEDTNVTKK